MPPKLADPLRVMKQKYVEIPIHVGNKLNALHILEFEVAKLEEEKDKTEGIYKTQKRIS
jgi:hypothetical protein